MKRLLLLVIVIVLAAAAAVFPAAPAEASKRCAAVRTTYIDAFHVRTFNGLGCTPARSLLKRYFRKVVSTAQVDGGCAQRRTDPDVGCQVGHFDCFVSYSERTRRLNGRCTDGDRAVRFIEVDRGPGWPARSRSCDAAEGGQA